jgi:hypothetical protein
MPKNAVRVVLAAAAAFAAAAIPSFGDPTGNVNGTVEDPYVRAIQNCRTLEQQVLALAGAGERNDPLSASDASTAATALQQAIDCLNQVGAGLEVEDVFQPSTLAQDAMAQIASAIQADQKALEKVNKGKPRGSLLGPVLKAERAKKRAQRGLMGVQSRTAKDEAALDANNQSETTYACDADEASRRIQAAMEESYRARARAMRQREARSPTDLTVWGSALTGPSTPPNYYFAFEGTESDSGYCFRSLGRQLFGPFEVHFLLGSFEQEPASDTGSACFELDMEGSDPLQFFATCGRRVGGGLQLFAQSHDGAAGNAYYPGETVREVRIVYDGTTFTCSSKPQGAPDFLYEQFATYEMSQGETALIGGFGASGLTKGAEIGLDEIYITAL